MTITDIIASTIITILPLGFLIPETDIRCWEVWGVYVDGNVYVCDLDDWNFEVYKYHEIGHVIWNEHLSKRDKQSYKEIYNTYANKGLRFFYSDYEMDDVEEDFCTNFSLMIIKENSNPYVMKRVRFIKKLLHYK